MALAVLCLSAMVVIYLYASYSFQGVFNYVDLNFDNRTAMDLLTSDVRQANKVTAFTTNSLTLQDADGGSIVYTYVPSSMKVTRTKGSESKTLLKNCDNFRFDLGERNPIYGSYDVYPAATNFAVAKVIDVSWRCTRSIAGGRGSSETVQTARIVIRKQGST